MEQKIAKHLKIGKIGENIASRFLEKRGYKIIERNFRRKWGEIDIICQKKEPLIKLLSSMWNKNKNVLCETNDPELIFIEVKTLKTNDFLKPEDNLTYNKQRKLIRTCELYISEKRINPNIDWRIDAILIVLNLDFKKAKIKHLKGSIY